MAELPVVKRLRKEVETLKRELNVELPKELERARAHGDLSENAEWAMAKQRQEFLRARLNNLEARIAELSMINLDSIPRKTVGLGSKVELEDLDGGTRSEFEIVQGGFSSARYATPAVLIVLVTLAFFGLTRVVFGIVDGRPRPATRMNAKRFVETAGVIGPPLLLLGLSLWLGLFTPSILREAWSAAVAQLFPTP